MKLHHQLLTVAVAAALLVAVWIPSRLQVWTRLQRLVVPEVGFVLPFARPLWCTQHDLSPQHRIESRHKPTPQQRNHLRAVLLFNRDLHGSLHHDPSHARCRL